MAIFTILILFSLLVIVKVLLLAFLQFNSSKQNRFLIDKRNFLSIIDNTRLIDKKSKKSIFPPSLSQNPLLSHKNATRLQQRHFDAAVRHFSKTSNWHNFCDRITRFLRSPTRPRPTGWWPWKFSKIFKNSHPHRKLFRYSPVPPQSSFYAEKFVRLAKYVMVVKKISAKVEGVVVDGIKFKKKNCNHILTSSGKFCFGRQTPKKCTLN